MQDKNLLKAIEIEELERVFFRNLIVRLQVTKDLRSAVTYALLKCDYKLYIHNYRDFWEHLAKLFGVEKIEFEQEPDTYDLTYYSKELLVDMISAKLQLDHFTDRDKKIPDSKIEELFFNIKY